MGTTGVDTDYAALGALGSGSDGRSTPSAHGHVVEGNADDSASEILAEPDAWERIGIIPRAVTDIFEKAEEMRRAGGRDARWECRCSFLELYNEVSGWRPGVPLALTCSAGPHRSPLDRPDWSSADHLDPRGHQGPHRLVGPARDQGLLYARGHGPPAAREYAPPDGRDGHEQGEQSESCDL